MAKDMTNEESPAARKAWLGLLARAPADRLLALMQASGLEADQSWLRAPEIGSVMVQGRAGATGAPFNMGEMTVTRASLRLSDGTVGHGYVQGRSKEAAGAAALVDALMQTEAAAQTRTAILDPLTTEETARKQGRAAKAAATKVDFFTMVRGED